MKVPAKRAIYYWRDIQDFGLTKQFPLDRCYHMMGVAKSSGHEPKNYFKGFQIGIYELFATYKDCAFLYLVKTIKNGVNEPFSPVLEVRFERNNGEVAHIVGQKFFCNPDPEAVSFFLPQSDKMEDLK